jgi:ABC-2 type transport system permease protein
MQRTIDRYRYSLILLKQLVKTDFKLRYQNSVLGYLWSLLRPLALFLIMYAVFVKVLHVDYGVPHSAVYLFLGLVLWNYFGEVTSGSIGSIVGKGDLLRKLNFPKYVIVLSGSIAALINLILNLIVVAIFMFFDKVSFGPSLLLFPLLVAELFIFALALAFFLSALFVRFRDINYIWEVVMQAGFYATPIFYPITLVPDRYAKILLLNPVAQIMQDSRYAVITHKVTTISAIWGSPWIRIVPFAVTLFIAIVATSYFRKRSKYFAEEI